MATKTLIQISLILALITGKAVAQATYSSQSKKTIAVMSIDSKNLAQNSEELANIARLKLQQLDNLTVSRYYDAVDQFQGTNIDIATCYSVKCLTEAGKALGVEQMLSGSAERMGEHIVINLVIVDVSAGKIIASDVNDYYNLGGEMEGMMEISINNLFDIESDELLVNALVRKEEFVNEQVIERLRLNGPRMGVGYVGGMRGQRLMDSKSENGYGMFPVMTQFGYQFEWQYLSAGNLQALIELIPLISGMDQGRFIPSITLLNGFRHSRSGWEIAFGPTFRVNQVAEGYYDDKNVWHRKGEWDAAHTNSDGTIEKNPFDVHENIDSKGDFKFVYGFTIAAGKTFRSGHMNIPVNAYIVPDLHGVTAGVSFGFNVRNRRQASKS